MKTMKMLSHMLFGLGFLFLIGTAGSLEIHDLNVGQAIGQMAGGIMLMGIGRLIKNQVRVFKRRSRLKERKEDMTKAVYSMPLKNVG